MTENIVGITKRMRSRYPNGSIRISAYDDELRITVSDGKFTFENGYAVNDSQALDATIGLALNDIVEIFNLDSADIPMARQRRTKNKGTTHHMDIVPLIPLVHDDFSDSMSDNMVTEDVSEPAEACIPVSTKASLDEPSVPAESAEPPAEVMESVAPRRRRRAADLYSDEELAAMMISPETITGKPAESETTVDQPLPNQITLDEALAHTEETTSTEIVSQEESVIAESVITDSVTIETDSVIPPSSASEDLERALGYVITVGVDSGHTLGELPEMHGTDAAIEKLNWLAYRYRGRDFELKNSAAIVLRALTA